MTFVWWAANLVALLVIVPLLVWLASRLIIVSREIDRYGRDISDHSGGIADNLAPAAALVDTRDLVGEVATHAGGYVSALERRV